MAKTKVLVLGASGMLGSMIVDVLSRDETLDVTATVRAPELVRLGSRRIQQALWRHFEISDEVETFRQLEDLGEINWAINAIGLAKPYTRDDNACEVKRAVVGNSLFPYWLSQAVNRQCGRVLQIATDCVYSGLKGRYTESDKHDALDVYGKTKSLGEALLPNNHCLRCSIIGPEFKSYAFLLEWFRRQPQRATLSGYTNHQWNGVTTLHFARLCHSIIRNEPALPHLQHVVPTGTISKHDLLCCFADVFQRQDITVSPLAASSVIDRTLATENDSLNEDLWKMAGYRDRPPTVPEMLAELAAFNYRFAESSR